MSNDNISKQRKPLPTLETERLVLRPFSVKDAPSVQRLAGAREVADTMLTIPHPYEDGVAEQWIGTHEERSQQGHGLDLAVVCKDGEQLVGAIGLSVAGMHERAELGYWIGTPWWNGGFCTEAARAIVRFGLEQLELNRISGHHFARNPASGRVMQKIGMKHEGTLRQHAKKCDRFEDIECYGILRDDT